MERIQLIEHKGAKIHFVDLTGLLPGEEMLAALNNVKETFQTQPKNSVLELIDITDMHFDTESLSRIKELSTANEPFVRANAVIGVEGLLSIGLNAVNRVSGRNMQTFTSKDEALDWLAAQ